MGNKPMYDKVEQKIKELANEVAELKKNKKRSQLLTSAIEGGSEGIAIIDLDGNLYYLNNAFALLHGYSVNDLLGKHFSIFHTPEQMPSVKAANRQVKEKGIFIGEIWHTRRDGTVFPTIMHNSLIRDEKGKPVGWLGTVRDISEQKQLEEDLLESGNKYRALFEGSTNPVTIFDRDGIILMVNAAGARNLDLPIEACIGKPITELLPDIDEVYPAIFQKVIDAGVEMTKEELVELPSGPRWFWSILEPVSNIHGKRYGVQVLSYDITERKKAEEKFRESEEMFNKIFHSSPAGMVITTLKDGKIINFNESLSHIIGYSTDEAIGRTSIEIGFWINSEDRDWVTGKLKKNGSFRNLEFNYRNKKGEIRLGKFSSEIINIQTEQCIITAMEDVTEKKQMEKALHKAKQELEKKVKQRTSQLEEKNITLKVLLDQRGKDRKQLEETIMSNIEKLIKPNLAQLRNSELNGNQKATVNILESNLLEIISPVASRLSSSHLKLTPTEIQVANHINQGASSNEIAESLSLSIRTIETHRYNIRKKIGIKGKRINLKTYLSSLNDYVN